MGRLVSFDYGRARIGMAISDENQILARALPTLKVPKKPDLLFKEIENCLKKEEAVEQFVVGLPLLLNGQEGEMAQEARQFGEILSSHFNIPCVFWDERLSSSQVDRMMREQSVNRKQRAQKVDAMSAVLILQNFMDAKHLSARKK